MEDKKDMDYNLETDDLEDKLQNDNKQWPKISKILLLISLCISLILVIVIIIVIVYYNDKLSENSSNDNQSKKGDSTQPQILDLFIFFGQKYSNLSYFVDDKIPNTFKQDGENFYSDMGPINNGQDYEKNERNIYDLYIPQYALDRKTETNGIILWIHGGAWVSGTKDDMDIFCKLYSQQGYISASVGYTLLGSKYKDFNIFKILDEITACIKAIKNKLIELGFQGDKLKMVIGGYSAGAHLALLYSFLIKNFDIIPIEFVINFVGPIGLHKEYFYKLKSENETLPSIEDVSEIEKAINEGKIEPMFEEKKGLEMMNLFLGNKLSNKQIEAMLDEKRNIKEDDENYKKLFKVAKYSFITEIEDNHQIPTICIYGGTDDTIGVTQYAYLNQKAGNTRHLDFIYSRNEGHDLIKPKTPDGVAKLWDASSLFMNYFKKYFGY